MAVAFKACEKSYESPAANYRATSPALAAANELRLLNYADATRESAYLI